MGGVGARVTASAPRRTVRANFPHTAPQKENLQHDVSRQGSVSDAEFGRLNGVALK